MKIIAVKSKEYIEWHTQAVTIAQKEIWQSIDLISHLNEKFDFGIEYTVEGYWLTQIIFPNEKKYLEFLMRVK